MHAFSVDKKMDYSIPIIFSSLPTSELQKAHIVVKPTAAVMQKITTVKPPIQKTKPKPMVSEQTKATSFDTFSIPSSVTLRRGPRVKETETWGIKTLRMSGDERPEAKKQEESTFTKASDFAKASSFANATADTSLDMSADKPKIEVKKEEPIKKLSEDKPKTVPEVKAEIKKDVAVKQEYQPSQSPTGVPVRNKMEHGVKNAHISNNYREVEALRRGAQLQKELVQQWHPPIGVSLDCMCDISFFVNRKGTIEGLKIMKSSGVMMFDISARQALFSMKMPQWTYGKPLIISFK